MEPTNVTQVRHSAVACLLLAFLFYVSFFFAPHFLIFVHTKRGNYRKSSHFLLCLRAGLWRSDEVASPIEAHHHDSFPPHFWQGLGVISQNYIVLPVPYHLFISLLSDIVVWKYCMTSLFIPLLSAELSEGRRRIKTRDMSLKWLFICMLSGLTLF